MKTKTSNNNNYHIMIKIKENNFIANFRRLQKKEANGYLNKKRKKSGPQISFDFNLTKQNYTKHNQMTLQNVHMLKFYHPPVHNLHTHTVHACECPLTYTLWGGKSK